jgi:ribulose-phosphate 3-epimerase
MADHRTPILAPSILAADFGHLADEIKACEMAGADWIHCDVMDGHYVPNLTFGPMIVRLLKKTTTLPLDVHLMITNPERSLEWYIDAGADHVSIHPETCSHLDRAIRQIRKLGAKAGVVLNPGSPLDLMEPVIDIADLILIMSVNPGFGGQDFIPNALKRIRKVRKAIDDSGHDIRLAVDGGIELENANAVVEAGANVLVAGTSIFKDGAAVTIPKFKRLFGA